MSFFTTPLIIKAPLKLQDEKVVESLIRKTLITTNQNLINQVEINKKHIKSLQSFLAWILSSPVTIKPEIASLLLSDNTINNSFDFELRLASEFNRYICKSKYFTFIVELLPLTALRLTENDRIQIDVKLFTSENAPKNIEKTMNGKNIIRAQKIDCLAFNEADRKYCARIKMQITEVSSHFVNGTVNLVVEKGEGVEYSIKPLVIKNLVVKAKEKTCIRFRELED